MGVLNITNDFTSGTTISSSQVNANHSSIETWSTTISDDNFSAAAGMYSAYRTIHEALGRSGSNMPVGTYYFDQGGTTVVASGGGGIVPHAKYLSAADFAIAGRTTKLRVRATVESNATTPAINFTFGLAGPVAVAGGPNATAYSVGTGVSGSAIAINTPPASTVTVGTSADFDVPGAGLYMLYISASATLAVDNMSMMRVELQQRWI